MPALGGLGPSAVMALLVSCLTVGSAEAGDLSASGVASATVIDPPDVLTSLADLPVRVISPGGSIRLLIPLAQAPSDGSSASSTMGMEGFAVGLPGFSGAAAAGADPQRNCGGRLCRHGVCAGPARRRQLQCDGRIQLRPRMSGD